MALKNPILSNLIAVDIPKLNEILDALSKANPTDVDGISTGAMRLYEVSSGKWQWQVYNGSTWASVPFLQHNVDQLGGYHAAITPAANTVAVRGTDGKLRDDITGNAATATTATTLSQTLPVNKGGTGATSSEAARANLGVPPTSHASTNTTHGVGNATQYGHLKLSDATNNLSGVSGGVAATPAAVKSAKDAADAAQSSANNAMTKASTLATASAPGIVKPGTGMTVDAAGALNVNASSAAIPGLVKSSISARAGVVPVGGADGTLGEDWLKKAMDAASAAQDAADRAQTTADEAIEAIPSAATYSKISERSSTGNWTITGCTIGKPLKIYLTFTKQQGAGGDWGSADLITVSGAEMGYIYERQAFAIGNGGTHASSNIFEIIPTSTNVVLNVYHLSSPAKLLAYN